MSGCRMIGPSICRYSSFSVNCSSKFVVVAARQTVQKRQKRIYSRECHPGALVIPYIAMFSKQFITRVRVPCSTFTPLIFSKIVLVAIQDSANTYGSAAIGALKRLGAREPMILEFRSSFALAGFAGYEFPSWVSQAQNKRYKGPSVLMVTIEGGDCSLYFR